jgi:hypothetical protein
LNRAGLVEVSESKHTVEVVLTRQEKIREIKSLAEQMGVDPKTLLGNNVTDAEFEEISAPSGDEEPQEDAWAHIEY